MLTKSIPNFERKTFEEISEILKDDSLYEAIEAIEEQAKVHEFEMSKTREEELLEQKKRDLIEKYLYEVDV